MLSQLFEWSRRASIVRISGVVIRVAGMRTTAIRLAPILRQAIARVITWQALEQNAVTALTSAHGMSHLTLAVRSHGFLLVDFPVTIVVHPIADLCLGDAPTVIVSIGASARVVRMTRSGQTCIVHAARAKQCQAADAY